MTARGEGDDGDGGLFCFSDIWMPEKQVDASEIWISTTKIEVFGRFFLPFIDGGHPISYIQMVVFVAGFLKHQQKSLL